MEKHLQSNIPKRHDKSITRLIVYVYGVGYNVDGNRMKNKTWIFLYFV